MSISEILKGYRITIYQPAMWMANEMITLLNVIIKLISPAYLRQWIGSALVQIMTCRLFGAKPLSKPMLGYCQLDN